MEDYKLYRIKTKDGAHINEKVKEDGSRAAIQFDEDNGLQGPVDLVEVDESEFTREIYVEVENEERSVKQILIEDAVAPALEKLIEAYLPIVVEVGFEAISQKAIPFIKAKGAELIEKARKSKAAKKIEKFEQEKNAVVGKIEAKVATEPKDDKNNTVVHTPEEVVKILCNMKYAAMYYAAGIRELSNTVIKADELDEVTVISMQEKIRELSTEDAKVIMDWMLEDKNRDMFDQATIQLFEGFRNGRLFVNGEVVPISKLLDDKVGTV